MDFVIQHNMLANDKLLAIKEAVQDLPHRFVGLIPFSKEITSNEPIVGVDHIPYGSCSFVEATYALGWKGLSFNLEKFCCATAQVNRNDMLNYGVNFPIEDAINYLKSFEDEDDVFVRPDHDLKQFSGAVYTAKEAYDFLTDAMLCTSSGSYKITPDTFIVVSRPQNILVEWRCFIISGKVCDISMYRRNGQLKKQHDEDGSLHAVAQELADKWLPDSCCVMDICLLESGETKVVEFNCINGSGFYDNDIKKVMTAWSKHHDN